MIVVTGGAGFIGSAIIYRLNELGENNIIVVDELGLDEKWKNLVPLRYKDFINKHEFLDRLESHIYKIDAIIHMGANSSTTEKDAGHLLKNNYEYSKRLALYCSQHNIRFIYASSAATYGDGSAGFNDSGVDLHQMRPLNMYGYSKNLFDVWAAEGGLLTSITGLKYFNVFGPNEYHKGDMRSVVHKAYEQIKNTGRIRLFKSQHPDYKDGEQMRDFVYVKDAVEMTLFFLKNKTGGIFNAGSGTARTWNDLAAAVFKAMDLPLRIDYIDLPEHLAEKYQYFTKAEMGKIKKAGYNNPVLSLEEGVTDYIQNYLMKNKYLGY
jgi:ADP-L-glycero-D-manno-heptose 6-epimerase